MLDELSAAEKIVEEFLIDLMTERVMSEREISASVQESLTRGVQALRRLLVKMNHRDH
jgi:hypothetical protein